MASINKLSIRGVRSFSSEDEEQVIEFLFPVTIIVGANGCGKTTIIESLKYAVTGSLPPGKNPGQSFVHDPKSCGQSVVKANIKLRFTTSSGQSQVVVRSMELTQKKKALSFKALDGVLRTTDPDTGERVSMSHKCTELDRVIPGLLGVSKPILEHVVFCHQEDSSWPLMDSAVLKKRFDDIFESTRYAKALKNIADIKKEYNAKAKDHKTEVAALSSHKHAAKSFRKELEQNSQELEELEETVQECQKNINKINKQNEEYKEVMEKGEEIRLEIEDHRSEIEKNQLALGKQRKMLETDYTKEKTMRELKEELGDFDRTIREQEDRQKDYDLHRKRLQGDIEEYHSKQNKLNSQIGKLTAEEENHNKLLRQRISKMESMNEMFGLDLVTQTQGDASVASVSQSSVGDRTATTFGTLLTEGGTVTTVSEEDMNAFLRALKVKESQLKSDLDSHRQTSTEEEDRLTNALSDLTAKKSSIENDIAKVDKGLKDAQNELQTIGSRSKHGRSMGRVTAADVKDAKENAKVMKKKHDDAQKEAQESDIQHRLRSTNAEIDKLKRVILDDQEILQELRSCSEKENELSVLKDQSAKELEELADTMGVEEFDFQKFNLELPKPLPGLDGDDERGDELVDALDNLATSLTEKYDAAQSKLSKAEADVAEKQRVVSEKSGLLTHSKQSLDSVKAKSAAGEGGNVGKFTRLVGDIRKFELDNGKTPGFDENDPQSVVSYLTLRIDEIDEQDTGEIHPEAVKAIAMRLNKMAVRGDELEDSVCPCCKRDFKNADGGCDLESMGVMLAQLKLFRDATNSPLLEVGRTEAAEAEKHRAMKSEYQQWRKSITEITSDVLEHKRIKIQMSELEATVKELESFLVTEQSALNTLKRECRDINEEVDMLRRLDNHMKRWSEHANRIGNKKHRISQKATEFSMSMTASAGRSNRDTKTVEKELQTNMEAKDKLQETVSDLNKKQMNLNSRVSNAATTAAMADKRVQEYETKFAEDQKDSKRRDEISSTMKELHRRKDDLSSQLPEYKRKITKKSGERDRSRELGKQETDEKTAALTTFNTEAGKLHDLNAQIDSFVNRDTDGLDALKEKIESLNEKVKERQSSLKVLEPKLEKLTGEINNQGRFRKSLQQNIEILHAEQNIRDLEKVKKRLEDDLAEIEGYDTVFKEYEENVRRKREFEDKNVQLGGRRTGFVDQIRLLKRKLKTEEYKDIDERHRRELIKMETTQIAVKDLEKYYNAFDMALLRYHGHKIGEINKIIKDLWTLTYKGEDISNIELISGADSAAKKSYNYRVVMSKGSTQLDMRGRCSAGQRVLASIVIRLALAESFCVKCGCIALDEPTVNLDYHNKRGLAIALAQIIASRAKQQNFQLLVITHDEEFVSLMKTELSTLTGFSMPDKYFQVSREEHVDGKFYSKISAVDWDEM